MMKTKVCDGIHTLIKCKAILTALSFVGLALSAQASWLTDFIAQDRAPEGSPVKVGIWNGDLIECKKLADKRGIPMIAVWSNEGCAHCEIFEKAAMSDYFRNWATNECPYILCFTSSLDKYGVRTGEEGTLENPGPGFYKHFCKKPSSVTSYPHVRFYWYQNGEKIVDFSTVGDKLDGQQGISNGTYDKAGKNVVNYILGKSGFAAYVPVPFNEGAEFAVPAEDAKDVDDCARIQAEPGTSTLYVPVVRTSTNALEQTLYGVKIPATSAKASDDGVAVAALAPSSPTNKITTIQWAQGVTNMTIAITNFDTNWYVEGGSVKLMFFNESADATALEVLAETTVRCVGEQENSAVNPDWIGERDIEYGRWTMDIDGAKSYVAENGGYTLAAVIGSLWCRDCANTERNFLGIKDGSGKNVFQEWAGNNKIALVAVDVPNFTDADGNFTSPALLSATPGESQLAYELPESGIYDVSKGGAPESLKQKITRSGLGYMTRKQIQPEVAAEQLKAFHRLVTGNDSANGELHRPEDTNPKRTGVPVFVLLNKDGAVVGRFTRFAASSPLTADVANIENIVKRFDEMLAVAGEGGSAHADASEVLNNHASSTTLAVAADGVAVSNELSCADTVDVFRLDGIGGGAEVGVEIKGSVDAKVAGAIVKLDADGKELDVGASVTNSLASGIVLNRVLADAGTYAVRVKVVGTDEGHFGYGSAEDTFAAYGVSATLKTLVPSEMKAVVAVPAGTTVVTLRLEKDATYRFDGIEAPADVLERISEGDNLYKSLVDGDREVPVSEGATEVTFQKWNPGTVGFTNASGAAKESDGEFIVGFSRRDGKSGDVKVRISVDTENTDYQTSEGENRYVFEPVEFEWKEGEAYATNVTVKLVDRPGLYDGDGNVRLVLELTEGSATTDITEFELKVFEKDTAKPGKVQFTAAEPYFAKPKTVLVKSGEVAKVYVSRQEASDGDATVKVSATAGTLSTNVLSWAHHTSEDVEVTLSDLAAGKTATLKLAYAGTAAIGKTNSVAVTAVAADAPEFVKSAYAETIYTYVAVSNLYPLAEAPKGKATFSIFDGKLPSGLKAGYDAVANAMTVYGTTTAKAGDYTVVYQAKDGTVKGLVTKIKFTVVDPTDKKRPDDANAAVSAVSSRTFKDLILLDPSDRMAGTAQVTVPLKGNASVKLNCSEGPVSLSAKNWSGFDPETKDLETKPFAKNGWEASVVAKADGGISVDVYTNGALYAKAAGSESANLWKAKVNPASDWAGYYTVILPLDGTVAEGTEGIAPTGAGYLTLKMEGTAANTGKMTWAGMLPNGQAVSGSAIVTGDGVLGNDGSVHLPVFYYKKGVDTFGGILKIAKNAVADENRRCVTTYAPFNWSHTESKTDLACFENAYKAYGCYYNKAKDDLLDCCEKTFSSTNLTFIVDGANEVASVTVTSSAMSVAKNAQSLTGSFNRSTGLYTGSFKTLDGVKVSYKGVILIGWGGIDCGCGDEPIAYPEPFVAGSYYYGDKLPYNDGKRDQTLAVKRGGKITVEVVEAAAVADIAEPVVD